MVDDTPCTLTYTLLEGNQSTTWASNSSALTLTLPPGATRSLRVLPSDAAGNVGSEVNHTWTVPPCPNVTTLPRRVAPLWVTPVAQGRVAVRTGAWDLLAAAPYAQVLLRVDGGVWAPAPGVGGLGGGVAVAVVAVAVEAWHLVEVAVFLPECCAVEPVVAVNATVRACAH